jgi:hypothetical protein
MPFAPQWTLEATKQFNDLRAAAKSAFKARKKTKTSKSSKAEGLYKQVNKTIQKLCQNPRQSGLHCHKYSGIANPYNRPDGVWEAYAQNQTPGAYRVFWCYGPEAGEITIIAIMPHP